MEASLLKVWRTLGSCLKVCTTCMSSLEGLVEKEISHTFLLLHFVSFLHLAEVPEDPLCSPELTIVHHLWAKTDVQKECFKPKQRYSPSFS